MTCDLLKYRDKLCVPITDKKSIDNRKDVLYSLLYEGNDEHENWEFGKKYNFIKNFIRKSETDIVFNEFIKECKDDSLMKVRNDLSFCNNGMSLMAYESMSRIHVGKLSKKNIEDLIRIRENFTERYDYLWENSLLKIGISNILIRHYCHQTSTDDSNLNFWSHGVVEKSNNMMLYYRNNESKSLEKINISFLNKLEAPLNENGKSDGLLFCFREFSHVKKNTVNHIEKLLNEWKYISDYEKILLDKRKREINKIGKDYESQ